MYTLITLKFNFRLEVLAGTMRQGKEIRGIRIIRKGGNKVVSIHK